MTEREALIEAINFIEELTNAAGKYNYIDKTSLVADAYKILSKLRLSIKEIK